MKFEDGDNIRIIERIDFDDSVIEEDTVGHIRMSCTTRDIFDYYVDLESGRAIKVREREVTHRYDPHNQLVYHQKREEWICPFCEGNPKSSPLKKLIVKTDEEGNIINE